MTEGGRGGDVINQDGGRMGDAAVFVVVVVVVGWVVLLSQHGTGVCIQRLSAHANSVGSDYSIVAREIISGKRKRGSWDNGEGGGQVGRGNTSRFAGQK